MRCVEAFLAHTPSRIALLVVDDGAGPSIDAAVRHGVPDPSHRRRPAARGNKGYVRSCNDAFAARPVVTSCCSTAMSWSGRSGSIGSLPPPERRHDREREHVDEPRDDPVRPPPQRPCPDLPAGLTPDVAARRVAAGSGRLRPTIPTAVGHCVYVRRHALDLVGPFDETFNPGYGEEVDFSQRAVAHGFRHVCADDVFAYHRGGTSFGRTPDARSRQARHEAIVRQRYPWYGPWVEHAANDPSSGLADALAAAQITVGLTVGIDALCLGPTEMGTQRIVVESIRSLRGGRRSRLPRLRPASSACVRRDPAVRAPLGRVRAGRSASVARRAHGRDLVYRPYQVSNLTELRFLHEVADRFVVNQLDTIAVENPAYFAATPGTSTAM